MHFTKRYCLCVVFAGGVLVGQLAGLVTSVAEPIGSDSSGTFVGSKAGDEREVAGIKLCWCPAGRFTMGSPRDEPERRPGEDQVDVTLTKGF